MIPSGRPFDAAALTCFEAVARLGSLARAASSLHIAASALSRRISQIEEDLGVRLFERLPRGMRLTGAGEILLQQTRLGFQEFERARGMIDEMRGLGRGHVRLAAVESAMRGMVVTALTAFWRRHPGIEVEVTVMGSAAATRQVESGEAELALTFTPVPVRLQAIARAALPIGAVMRPDHALAGCAQLRLGDMAGYPILLADPSLRLHDAVRTSDDLVRMFPRPRFSTNSITLMSLLAVHGAGIALKTRLGVEDEIRRGELVFVTLAETALPLQNVVLWARRREDLSAAARALAAALVDELQQVNEIEAAPAL